MHRQERQTKKVDMFRLGCVLSYFVTGGQYPFGDHVERDLNIKQNLYDLKAVEDYLEAFDLIKRMLNPNPDMR